MNQDETYHQLERGSHTHTHARPHARTMILMIIKILSTNLPIRWEQLPRILHLDRVFQHLFSVLMVLLFPWEIAQGLVADVREGFGVVAGKGGLGGRSLRQKQDEFGW